MKEVYIGDGVYVTYDGYSLILRTERDGRNETIYLEPDIFNALLKVAKGVGMMTEYDVAKKI